MTQSDGVFHVTWGWEFLCYNLSLQHDPADALSGTRRWDVTGTSRWREYLGARIVDVRVGWVDPAALGCVGIGPEYP